MWPLRLGGRKDCGHTRHRGNCARTGGCSCANSYELELRDIFRRSMGQRASKGEEKSKEFGRLLPALFFFPPSVSFSLDTRAQRGDENSGRPTAWRRETLGSQDRAAPAFPRPPERFAISLANACQPHPPHDAEQLAMIALDTGVLSFGSLFSLSLHLRAFAPFQPSSCRSRGHPPHRSCTMP